MPLQTWALVIAHVLSVPHVVTECDQKVSDDVTYQAKCRNLVIKFGPKTNEWRLVTDIGGVSIDMRYRDTSNDQVGTMKEMFPSESPISGGEGVSEDV